VGQLKVDEIYLSKEIVVDFLEVIEFRKGERVPEEHFGN
jgi:hypothetical protein